MTVPACGVTTIFLVFCPHLKPDTLANFWFTRAVVGFSIFNLLALLGTAVTTNVAAVCDNDPNATFDRVWGNVPVLVAWLPTSNWPANPCGGEPGICLCIIQLNLANEDAAVAAWNPPILRGPGPTGQGPTLPAFTSRQICLLTPPTLVRTMPLLEE